MEKLTLTRQQHIALHFLSLSPGRAFCGTPPALKEIEKMGLIRFVIGMAAHDGSPEKGIWELTNEGEDLIKQIGAPDPMYQ